MIIKCTNPGRINGLTYEKLYRTYNATRNTYYIRDDKGRLVSLKKEYFEKMPWYYGFIAFFKGKL